MTDDDASTGSATGGRSPGGRHHGPDVARRLEAILLVVDEPQSLVSLATAVAAPVPAVRQAIESLVEDYDGLAERPSARFRAA